MIPKLHNFMGRSPTRLYREKLWEMSEKPTNKSKHSQNNQFWSRSFRDERYPGKLRCKFTGTYAVAYAVIRQLSEIKQWLIWSKWRLSKKQLAIATVELVAAEEVASLVGNIRNSLPNHNIREVYGWSDGIIVLHGLQGNRSFKQFVHKRVKYINSKKLGGILTPFKILQLSEVEDLISKS